MRLMFQAALVTGLFYGWYASAAMYGFWQPWCSPPVIGLGVGLALGDPATGVLLGGMLQAIYLGMIAPGGNTPSEPQLAASVAIPIAMATGMDFNTAVALAVPVDILGAFVTVLRYIIDGFFVEPADNYAAKADTRGLWRCAFLWPFIIKFVLGFLIVFCAVMLGTDAVQAFVSNIPEWLQHGLSVAGGILPAIGFALMVLIIDRTEYIPLFLIGYFMVQYGGLSVMACAIFAVCAALFITFFRMDIVAQAREGIADDEEDEEEEDKEPVGNTLDRGDVNRFIFRWLLYAEVPHSYQRMQGLAVSLAMVPALKKMYPGEENKDKLAAVLVRESMYFNTEALWGASVVGVALAMEKEQAATQAMSDQDATASINGLKVGFMGPLAGIGDSIDWATVIMLCFSLAIIGIAIVLAAAGIL